MQIRWLDKPPTQSSSSFIKSGEGINRTINDSVVTLILSLKRYVCFKKVYTVLGSDVGLINHITVPLVGLNDNAVDREHIPINDQELLTQLCLSR